MASGRRKLQCCGVPTTSVRRCMRNHHVNATIASKNTSSLLSKVKDMEEPEVKIAGVRQRRHVARLRPGRNIVQGPFVRRQPRRWWVRPWLDAGR